MPASKPASKFATLSAVAALALGSAAHAALVAGDIAIIGRTNNTTPDVFTIVTLAPVAAGEVVYFTDNGWTGSAFRGSTATDGDGNEGLTRLTVNNALPAGTILSSNSTSANFTWATSGTIPGVTTVFSALAFATSGDQIYAFQNAGNNPLFNVATQNHLFVLDDTNGFENAADSGTGNITPGLSIAANTAVSVNFPVAGTHRFNTAALTSGTKAQWLAAIGNTANWAAGTLPSGSIAVASAVSADLLDTFVGTPTATVSVAGSGNAFEVKNVALGGVTSGTVEVTGDLAGSAGPILVYLDLATDTAALGLTAGGNLASVQTGTFDLGTGVTYDALLTYTASNNTADSFFFSFAGLPAINNLAIVPEPSALGLLIPAAALLGRRRK